MHFLWNYTNLTIFWPTFIIFTSVYWINHFFVICGFFSLSLSVFYSLPIFLCSFLALFHLPLSLQLFLSLYLFFHFPSFSASLFVSLLFLRRSSSIYSFLIFLCFFLSLPPVTLLSLNLHHCSLSLSFQGTIMFPFLLFNRLWFWFCLNYIQ